MPTRSSRPSARPERTRAFTFTSFGDQGTPTTGKVYVPPAGVTIANPPFVNDNLGSPAAGDTTAGVERVQPLFHLFNGDLCYANLATDRVRTWSDFWENNTRTREIPSLDAVGRQPREREGQRPDRISRLPDLLLGAAGRRTDRRSPRACGTRSPSDRSR